MAIHGIGLAEKVIMFVENQKMASPSSLQEEEGELGS